MYLALAATVGLIAPRVDGQAGSRQETSAGVNTPAVIRRDEYGVPHILATTERAAAMAHGYSVAEDHVEALARLFLRAQGRLAEKFGERYVEGDFLIRRLGIPEVAARRFRELPPHIQAIFEGFAGGYNAYLTQHRGSVPQWAEAVTGADVLAHVRAVSLVDFALDVSAWQKAPAVRSEPKGSLMWLVGRSKSRSGRGLMLANPHLIWNDSRVLHEFHLRVPEYIDVAGIAPIGIPAVVMGFNQRLGWTLTVNQVDSEDIYELTLPPDCPGMYLYDHECRPLRKDVVKIKVKTAGGLMERELVVHRSHHGPIIRREGEKAWAYRSANLDQIDFVTQLNAMAKARSLAEFQVALNRRALPLFNVGYTDRDGNLFYLFNGRIPERPRGYRWNRAVPGDTSRSEWQGLVPIARLPQLLNPAAGYIQNANDPPWLTVLDHPLDPDAFPSVAVDEGLTLRGQHALQAIRSKQRVTLADLLAMKNDTTWVLASRLKADLIETIERAAPQRFAKVLDVLRVWDNRASETSVGAVLFWRWWERYQKAAKTVYLEPWDDARPLETPTGIGDETAAVKAFRSAVEALEREYGDIAPAWGDVYRFRRGGLDLPIAGASGETGSLRVLYFKPDADHRWSAVAGDAYTLGVEFQDVPIAYSVLPYSQSSRPGSAHYNDQARLFVRQRYKRLWFSEADLQAHTQRSYQVPGSLRSGRTRTERQP